MKHSLFITTFTALLFSLSPAPAMDSPRTYVIGVSPNLVKSDRDEVLRQLLFLALERASTGDTITVYDAFNLQPATRLTIPNGKQYEGNARARAQKMKAEMGALKEFFTREVPHPANEAGELRAPQFLELLGSQLRLNSDEITVILIGSAFYRDAREPAFNISDGFYPSDGHIVADQKTSIYGTANKRDALKNVAVHYCYLHENFASDELRNRVGRFWTLFVSQQGGVLASFAADLPLTTERALKTTRQPFMQAAIDANDLKIQMHKIGMRTDRSWIENDTTPKETTPPPVTVGKLKVGIRWASDVDIDLYVRPRAGAVELYYGRNRSSDGVHNKEFESSPTNSKGFETVECYSDVDLKNVEAAVNFYSGTSPGGVTGIIRVLFNDKLYESPFRIIASSGNRGDATSRRGGSDYWQTIDLLQIVGLRK